eukprot:10894-Heterococcus_DN1.PRE.1
MQANTRVPGAQGQLLDYYDWRLDPDDTGMLHLLHRDLPDAASAKKQDHIDDGEEADEEDVAVPGTTRSRSTRSIASSYVRAMHIAIIVLGREARPR